MVQKRGCFISIEGVEGVGKSTAVRAIRDWMDAEKLSCVLTREPGGTPIAESIRSVLLDKQQEAMTSYAELLLMFAGRAQNIAEVIRPALERGDWVLSDRFTDASFAYQGGGRGIPLDRIATLAEWVQGDLQPDMTLLLDAPVSVGLSRVKERGEKDRIEAESSAFFERVRHTYLDLARQYPERYHVINAEQDVASVKLQVLEALSALLERV